MKNGPVKGMSLRSIKLKEVGGEHTKEPQQMIDSTFYDSIFSRRKQTIKIHHGTSVDFINGKRGLMIMLFGKMIVLHKRELRLSDITVIKEGDSVLRIIHTL